MDIFNRKLVAELQEKLADTERSRNMYRCQADEFRSELQCIRELMDAVPEGCAQGPWCKACEFVEGRHARVYGKYGPYTSESVYVCGKGNSCKNFVRKQSEEE